MTVIGSTITPLKTETPKTKMTHPKVHAGIQTSHYLTGMHSWKSQKLLHGDTIQDKC